MNDLEKLKRLTNIDDLLDDGIENQSALKQLVQPAEVSVSVDKRSTTDPYEIGLAEATMAGKIDKASPATRHWAWLLLAMPPIVGWILLVYHSVTAPSSPELAHAIVYETGRPYEADRTIDWIPGIGTLIPACTGRICSSGNAIDC